MTHQMKRNRNLIKAIPFASRNKLFLTAHTTTMIESTSITKPTFTSAYLHSSSPINCLSCGEELFSYHSAWYIGLPTFNSYAVKIDKDEHQEPRRLVFPPLTTSSYYPDRADCYKDYYRYIPFLWFLTLTEQNNCMTQTPNDRRAIKHTGKLCF